MINGIAAMTDEDAIICETCGYDLRDNEPGYCPECGAPVPKTGRMPPQWWVLVAIAVFVLGLVYVPMLVRFFRLFTS